MGVEVMDNLMGKMSLSKWIALAVVLAIVAFVVLTQFTSFQVPESRTQDKPVPDAPVGVQSEGSTATENNLDAVNDILRGTPENTQTEETDNEN